MDPPTRPPKRKSDDEDGSFYHSKKAKGRVVAASECPYLDTIDRSVLDFDFEKLCSVTSENFNIYCCLVCGRYFKGRSQFSPAHTHSLQSGHHMFINLQNQKVYCLPDDYEVDDPSLEDIQFVLHPTFSWTDVASIDKRSDPLRALDGTEYHQGVIGLNNVKHNDYINVVLQALSHVTPLRNFFLVESNYRHNKSPLVQTFGELMRKMWNPRCFKAHVSPHEIIQAVSKASDKRFTIGKQGSPVEFLSWFLTALHRDLVEPGKGDPSSSIVHSTFQGRVRIGSRKVGESDESSKKKMKVTESNFIFLTLDIPPPPLFKDDVDKNIIPQVPLFTVLSKFDGETEQHIPLTGEMRRYIITKLPKFLIFHLKRFTKNNWYTEKNPTIVNSPIRHVDLRPYTSFKKKKKAKTVYNLLANITHVGDRTGGDYRVHIHHKGSGNWFEVQDLILTETMPQLITVSEAFIQIYELQE